MRKLTIKEGKKVGLNPEEVTTYNEWEYRNAEGGRTPWPSRLTEEELDANRKAIKDFTTNHGDLEEKFYRIKSLLDRREDIQFSHFALILAIISVVLFFKGYI